MIVDSTTSNALALFFSWVFTPIGATLTLLILIMGGGSLIARIMGQSGRLLKTLATIAAVLFFVWVITGILSAMGIPVRDWLLQIGSYIPDLLAAFVEFIQRLVSVTG